MQPASTVEGWLEDAYEQGMQACERTAPIAANIEPQHANPIRKRRALSLPIVETRQKRQKQPLKLEPGTMGSVESSRALRSSSRNRSREQASRYTTSINNALGSSLVMLTSATTLSQTSIASGSKTRSRTRSRSPAKTFHDLENADPPTTYLQMRHPGNEVPFTVQKLNNKVLRATRRGRGLMPRSIRTMICSMMTRQTSKYLIRSWPLYGYTIMRGNALNATSRKQVGEKKLFGRCSIWLLPEQMGEPQLRITSTNIQPPTLIPRGSGVEGFQYEGKGVDYGLFIEPTKDEIRKIKDRLK
ncbi:hypothetical protein BKA65DRAFT_103914 [Rhexocercosporidium sp. MPI-PUGE-AT-0058]|nr:hypothetical protein BKA65DRAFT_103914 [Rhexocercosporidium sp. MPI-PUGE-AT-0058]